MRSRHYLAEMSTSPATVRGGPRPRARPLRGAACALGEPLGWPRHRPCLRRASRAGSEDSRRFKCLSRCRSRSNPLQVADDKYSALLASDAQGPRVVFRGTISTVNPAVILNPFVDAVHGELARLGQKRIRVDLRELEFCNSSGFKSFIHWIERIGSLPEAEALHAALPVEPRAQVAAHEPARAVLLRREQRLHGVARHPAAPAGGTPAHAARSSPGRAGRSL